MKDFAAVIPAAADRPGIPSAQRKGRGGSPPTEAACIDPKRSLRCLLNCNARRTGRPRGSPDVDYRIAVEETAGGFQVVVADYQLACGHGSVCGLLHKAA